MPKYLTSDGNNWDELLCDDSKLMDELHSHDIFYVISLINARYLYDAILKNRGEDVEVCIDLIFDSLYNENNCSEIQWVGTSYLLNCLIATEHEGMIIKVSNSIEDENLIVDLLLHDRIISVKFESMHIVFNKVEENCGMETTIKFKGGHVMQIVSTSKRIIFNKLLKVL